MKRRAAVWALFWAISAGFFGGSLLAQDGTIAIPKKPSRYVTDRPKVLSAQTRTALEAKLKTFGDETGNQVVVWIGSTLPADTTIEEYANASFNLWGIGQKEKNNGVLLMLFIKSRKMRIETGDGIRDRIPNARATLIIDGMKPKLRAADYDGAVVDATDEILKALNPPAPVRDVAAEIAARRAASPIPAVTTEPSKPPPSGAEMVGACAVVTITAVGGLIVLILIIKAIIGGLARGVSAVGTTFSSGGADYTRVDHYHHGGGWRWGGGNRTTNNTVVRTVVHHEPRVSRSYSSSSDDSSSSSSSSSSGGSSGGGGFSGGGSSSGGGASGSW